MGLYNELGLEKATNRNDTAQILFELKRKYTQRINASDMEKRHNAENILRFLDSLQSIFDHTPEDYPHLQMVIKIYCDAYDTGDDVDSVQNQLMAAVAGDSAAALWISEYLEKHQLIDRYNEWVPVANEIGCDLQLLNTTDTSKTDKTDEQIVSELIETARQAYSEKRFAQSRQDYEKILAINPEQWEAMYYVGMCKVRECGADQIADAAMIMQNTIGDVFDIMAKDMANIAYVPAITDQMIDIETNLSNIAYHLYNEQKDDPNAVTELVKSQTACANALYELGDQIEMHYSMMQDLKEKAADAWEAGVKIHSDSLQYQPDTESPQATIDHYNAKIETVRPKKKPSVRTIGDIENSASYKTPQKIDNDSNKTDNDSKATDQKAVAENIKTPGVNVSDTSKKPFQNTAMEKGKKAAQNLDQIKGKTSAALSKTNKGLLIGLGIAVVAIIALLAFVISSYNSPSGAVARAMRSTEVDLTKTLGEPRYSGANKKAVVEKPDQYLVDCNTHNAKDYYVSGPDRYDEIDQLLDTVTYTMDKKDKLANGDVIKVTAKYDKTLAEELKINVSAYEKEFKVQDLSTRYESAAEINKEDLKAITDYTYALAKEKLTSSQIFNGLNKMYFVKEADTSYESAEDHKNGDKLIMFYSSQFPGNSSYTTVYRFIVYPVTPELTYKENLKKLIDNGEVTVDYLNFGPSVDKTVNDTLGQYVRENIEEIDVTPYNK